MPSYAEQLDPVDRWAVAAYIRALQLSQHAPMADVPTGQVVRPVRQIALYLGLPEPVRPRESKVVNQPQSSHAEAVAVAPSVVVRAQAANPLAATAIPPTAAPSGQESKPTAAPVPDAAAGQTVYSSNCQMCHQANRAGIPPAFPSLVDIVPELEPTTSGMWSKAGFQAASPPCPHLRISYPMQTSIT